MLSARIRLPAPASERTVLSGVYVANEKFDLASANAAIEADLADAIAFGKAYIANPDLVERLKTGAPLNTPDPSTFYGFENGARGYTDYPTLQQVGEPA